MIVTLDHPELWSTYAEAVKPSPELIPSEFAAKYRVLHEVYCSERPGPWNNDVFPYQPHTMNMVKEAVDTGKRGVVYMKGGQVGGTDMAINGMMWLKVYLPGPQLFMTATDDVAGEFGRERFENIIRDCPPLAAKYIYNARGDILTKRFVDGKIQLTGGQSVFNLQSTPYRVVVIDELDSLTENLGGQGDPLKLAEVRTDSFSGQTLMIAYAHPSTRNRGSARLYYEDSDQRRAFVEHSACGSEFYIQWDHVKCVGDKKNPADYVYACPHCGEVIEDAERVAMIRRLQYRSVLPPEVAATKSWIGAQFGQLLSPAKSIRSLARRLIECGDDENAIRVFFNKVLGEPRDPKVQKVDTAQLRSLIVVNRRPNDPEFYSKGQVPPAVRFLTAGQDSRTTELHYSVWGWGLRVSTDGTKPLCGWLIDWGVIARAYSIQFSESEYHVFDDLIYRRTYLSVDGSRRFNVRQCGHDVSYPPTQIPIHSYCRHWLDRAIPVKGASLEASSASNAPYARWGTPMKFKVGEHEVVDRGALIVNTFMLKTDFYGWVDAGKKFDVMDPVSGPRSVSKLTLPEDVDDAWITQTRNEELRHGKKNGELIWAKAGPNHWADCNTYALGCAYNLDPFQGGLTSEEYAQRRGFVRRESPVVRMPQHDPSLG